jgi:16S rRNA (guanine527-N7)-methyltransferase
MAEAWQLFNDMGISLDGGLVKSIGIYIEEMVWWNQKINLTALKDREEILIKHILSSLSYLKAFSPKPGLRAVDIGSGAGLPGIPIKLYCPEISLTLLEPSQKKLAFLKHIGRILKLRDITYLGIPVEIFNGKKEFDLAFARGFGPLSRLARKIGEILAPGGLLLVRKEEKYLPEVMSAAAILARKGMKLDRVVHIDLDSPGMKYYILAYRLCFT